MPAAHRPPLHPSVALSAFLLVACSVAPGTLADPVRAELEAAEKPAAPPIYEGRTFDPEGALAFTYSRTVTAVGAALVSTHLTRDLADRPVVLHRATHTDDYRLVEYREIQGQTGVSGSVRVEPSQGVVRFETLASGRTRTTEEPLGDVPIVVGPTLFGFARQHWDALIEGETRAVRFASVDQGRTYAFTLRAEAVHVPDARFVLEADDPLVRMAIGPMTITFDATTRTPRRFTGRVPPMLEDGGRLRPFAATVDYAMGPQAYR